jgi:hypothetical protein
MQRRQTARKTNGIEDPLKSGHMFSGAGERFSLELNTWPGACRDADLIDHVVLVFD